MAIINLLYFIETQPLIGGDGSNPGSIYKCVFYIFYLICWLTGQLAVVPTNCKAKTKIILIVLTIITTLIFLAINILSLMFDIYIIAWCPYQHCSYISYKELHTSPPTVTQNVFKSHEIHKRAVQPVNLTIFNDWQKTVITTATVSGTTSYLFMIYVLQSQYGILRKLVVKPFKKGVEAIWNYCGENPKPLSAGVLLSPFKDSNENTATTLSPKQSFYFMTIFIMNILLYGGNVVLLFVIYHKTIVKSQNIIDKKQQQMDVFGLAFQFASQLCAIISCFVFSKVAYRVKSICTQNLPELFERVDKATNISGANENIIFLKEKEYITDADINKYQGPGSRLYLLKVILKWYDRMLHTTLYPFGTWFAVHWILFSITAFMSISYLAEMIILELYGQEAPDRKCHGEPSTGCRLRLAYVFLFALEHCILFIYPCFRAASVTTAYTTMIKKVSNAEWVRITLDEKEKFIDYLKIQDCTFKISILCAKLSFGFYIAYFSIFVGILGVTLKLAL